MPAAIRFPGMLPIHDDNPVRRPPVITWAIIAACIGIYFFWQPSPFGDDNEDTRFNVEYAAIPCEVVEGRPLDTAEADATFGQRAVLVGSDDESCDIDGGQSPAVFPEKNVWLSVITSMFLHGSLLHIGGNLLFLWVFGNNIEDVLGKVGFMLFYVAGGVAATLTHVALNLDSTVPMVGASGAIAAVMGAYLVLFPKARVYTLVFFILITVLPLRAWMVLGFWFVLQFFTDPNSGVAWGAHVGGFVFGVLVGLVVRAARGEQAPPQRRPPPAFGGGPRPAWNDPGYGGYR
jgi:membrane associated rhomboid family serine protease